MKKEKGKLIKEEEIIRGWKEIKKNWTTFGIMHIVLQRRRK